MHLALLGDGIASGLHPFELDLWFPEVLDLRIDPSFSALKRVLQL